MLTYIRQMNWVNSWNDLTHDDSTINIVLGIIIIIIIINIMIYYMEGQVQHKSQRLESGKTLIADSL